MTFYRHDLCICQGVLKESMVNSKLDVDRQQESNTFIAFVLSLLYQYVYLIAARGQLNRDQ
jgi:hypothetical protein